MKLDGAVMVAGQTELLMLWKLVDPPLFFSLSRHNGDLFFQRLLSNLWRKNLTASARPDQSNRNAGLPEESLPNYLLISLCVLIRRSVLISTHSGEKYFFRRYRRFLTPFLLKLLKNNKIKALRLNWNRNAGNKTWIHRIGKSFRSSLLSMRLQGLQIKMSLFLKLTGIHTNFTRWLTSCSAALNWV